MALRAVWAPTIERNQRPSVTGSRAKASAVAVKPPAVTVYSVAGAGVVGGVGCVLVMSILLSWYGRAVLRLRRCPSFPGWSWGPDGP